MMIYEALSSLGVPVCHPPYKGAEETYITYQLLGQSGQLYAEGGEAETGVQYAVSIFAEGFAAGHTIHRGLVYAAPLDVVERLQLQAWMAGDYA